MGLVQRPMNPKVKDMVIGQGKRERFSKSPRECKKQERMRWAKDAQDDVGIDPTKILDNVN